MNVRALLALAKDGRPDLAAKNLGSSGAGAWRHSVRLLRIIRKYPHSSGAFFSMRYLALCWKDGRAEAVER
jgi:hypothetical protein